LPDELSELVDSPVERLYVEYKSWINLTEHKTRADLARHIAAIANFGGGYIVFGIDNDGRSCGPIPAEF
jgi:predicted HTH transcriptional regulator